MRFTVEENGKKQEVFIPPTGDRQYDEALVEAYTEKTKSQLRKQKPLPVSKLSLSDKQDAVREMVEYRHRKQGDHPRKYW
jgi:hypothetical protein